MDDESKKLISDFNEAKFQIFRMHDSWEECKKFVRTGKLGDWNWELDNIYGELVRDAEIEDKEKSNIKLTYKCKMDLLNNLIAKYRNDPSKFYKILRLKERILRRLQDASGKGSKRSSEDEDDLDN